MRRYLPLLLAFVAAAPLLADAQTQIVLEGSSNVTGWRCSGTAVIDRFELTVPVAALRCGNRHMERDLYRALRAQTYPSIEFRFTEFVGVNDGIERGTYRATIAGELSLAGETRTIHVPVEAERLSPQRLRLRARLPLRMTDFRITPPTALFGLVKANNDLVVQFDLMLEQR